MTKDTAIKLFEQKKVRSVWNEQEEKWYFSIVDVVGILSESVDPPAYWRKLKERLKKEGNETVTNCHGLKMIAEDGKMRTTDIADTEQLFRLIQSIPSPKAEPFKMWLAKVGRERMDEIEDPEIGLDRMMEIYLRKGYSKEWINQRLKSIEIRKELTDEWENRGVKKGDEFAILTDEISKAWSGFTTKEYKNYKDLKKENLRDHMTNLELVLNMLAEATTTEISKEKKPDNFEENKKIAKQGGTIAGNTRKEIEEKTGKKVVSKKNAKKLESSTENGVLNPPDKKKKR
ncbi:MAG TPA: BRO family protein [bacterium]|nr:BRO family protein [bacterium]HPS30463.1 BRO family protein [bacterium]